MLINWIWNGIGYVRRRRLALALDLDLDTHQMYLAPCLGLAGLEAPSSPFAPTTTYLPAQTLD
jgi:hypothetical protein